MTIYITVLLNIRCGNKQFHVVLFCNKINKWNTLLLMDKDQHLQNHFCILSTVMCYYGCYHTIVLVYSIRIPFKQMSINNCLC